MSSTAPQKVPVSHLPEYIEETVRLLSVFAGECALLNSRVTELQETCTAQLNQIRALKHQIAALQDGKT